MRQMMRAIGTHDLFVKTAAGLRIAYSQRMTVHDNDRIALTLTPPETAIDGIRVVEFENGEASKDLTG